MLVRFPYNYGQVYAPKTAVGIIEETHLFTPNLVNQLKYGYARYNGPTFDADQAAGLLRDEPWGSPAAQQARLSRRSRL